MLLHRWFGSRKTLRKPSALPARRFVPFVELLEKRELLASNQMLYVTTVIDNGDNNNPTPGSLRAAIIQANADTNDTIYFNIPNPNRGVSTQFIQLKSNLPLLAAPMTINGYGRPSGTPNNEATPNTLGPGQGTNANIQVQILPAVGGATIGFDVGAQASGTVIKGLAITGFSTTGIQIETGATGVKVVGNFIGFNAHGLPPNAGRNQVGILINAGSTGNFIGTTDFADRNLISGNANQGVLVLGDGNIIVNNLIGTDKLGQGNAQNASGQGIFVQSSNNIIGGTAPGARNVISGNGTNGVDIFGPNSQAPITGNQVLGNFIGTSANGLSAEANLWSGIVVNDAGNTTISGNLIAANNPFSLTDPSKFTSNGGVLIGSPKVIGSSTNTLVTGNTIGLSLNGSPLGNGFAGILVENSASATIGGTSVAARNVISGNKGKGIIVTSGTSGTVVQGNYIGLQGDGTTPAPNTKGGVQVSNKASATIGGTAANAGNFISGNRLAGILVNSLGTALIQGNYIGVGGDFVTPVGNGEQGVYLLGDNASTVGGTAANAGNMFSGNGSHGVEISQSSKGDLVQGNVIGLDVSGSTHLANGGVGVLVNKSSNVTVGGAAAGAGNFISGNKGGGVDISASSNTLVAGNQIGTDLSGSVDVPNKNYGIQVENGSNGTTIGGTTADAGNLISGNDGNGINAYSGSILIQGNQIGTDSTGTLRVPNIGSGIYITPIKKQSNDVTVGGTTAAARNIISGNTQYGIYAEREASPLGVFTRVTIQGNYIGTDADGSAPLGNQDGVRIKLSDTVTVGGTVPGAGNVISGNTNSGVKIIAAKGILVAGNFIGTDKNGAAPIANQIGVNADGASVKLTIGGTSGAARNVISGNTQDGVLFQGGSGMVVQGNYIGLNSAGSAALGNGANGIKGIALLNSTIGGISSAAANVISGNANGSGILLNRTRANVAIVGNFIGTDSTGLNPIGNKAGISLTNGSDPVTIGVYPNAGNVISGNDADGVDVLSGTAILAGNSIGLAQDKSNLGNGGYGVLLASNNNLIGPGNYISGNAKAVVRITGNNNTVSQSTIGTNNQIAVANAIGIEIFGSNNTIASGNVISGNTGDGVLISSGSDNTLNGNLIGVLLDGSTALANGGAGVHVAGGSNHQIGVNTNQAGDRNIISANTGGGVLVENATGTTIVQNYIGTDKAGQNPLGNGITAGVILSTGAVKTTIGGTATGAGNLISGNFALVAAHGVQVQNNARGTLIQGNYIGLKANGTAPLANFQGIVVQDTAANTTIGGTATGASNTIGGNLQYGIVVQGAASGTAILGNTVGLDKSGNAQGNPVGGILIGGGSKTTIGGGSGPTNTIDSSRNVISGNTGNGITVKEGSDLRILHNLIGTDLAGTSAKPNSGAGIAVNDVSATIAANIVSGNASPGILLFHAQDVSIVGNFVGLTVNGNAPLSNGSHGIQVVDAVNTTIGGKNQTNMIAANMGDGIQVAGHSSKTIIQGNGFGQAFGSLTPLPNTGNGINLTGFASETTIGGTANGEGNIISANSLNGVHINVDTRNTLLQGNSIGVDFSTNKPLANGLDGVHVLGAFVTIGGSAKGAGNIISGNNSNGIQVSGATASATLIQGNKIGTNSAGTDKVANGLDGVRVANGANDVSIGGTVTSARNAISGNGGNGIHIFSAPGVGNGVAGILIQGNEIGGSGRGNTLYGVFLDGVFSTLDSISLVAIGGGSPGSANDIKENGQGGIVVANAMSTLIDSNQILSNGGDGIRVTEQSGSIAAPTTISNNRISGNTNGVEFGASAVGLSLTSNRIQSNEGSGVLINGQNVTIGGGTAGQGNTITSNSGSGIGVGATAVNIGILGNLIGTNSRNILTIGNDGDGISITGGVLNVTIGGTAAGAGNVISGNLGNGVHLKNVSSLVRIVGNRIGTSDGGVVAVKNALDGVLLDASSNAQIESNTISGNGQNGVELKNGSHGNVVKANNIGVGINGTSNVGNRGFGVWVHQGGGAASSGNTIGNTAAGGGNIMGFNKEGVVIGDSLTDSSQRNAILGNAIFKSSVLIDLGNTGSGSYVPDKNAGPNLLEVPPTLISATVSGSTLQVNMSLTGTSSAMLTPPTTFRIEFFAEGSTFGPFKKFLGFVMVTTNASGDFGPTLVQVQLPQGVQVPPGTQVSATATDPNGNTTGFATAVMVS